MKNTLILFLGIFFLTASSKSILDSFLPNFQDSKNSLMNAYVTKSGNIPMTYYGWGWSVPIDISDHEDDASEGSNSYSMILGLYTSQTFYVDSCIDFYPYYCWEYATCTQHYSTPFSFDYVQFTATGHMINAPMYMDYTYWENQNQIGFATSCQTFTTMPFMPSTYGMIGLGFSNGGQNNFLSSKIFSLNLNMSNNTGNLMFGSQFENLPNYVPVATITTNNNWQTNTVASLGIGANEFAVTTTVLFDLNSDMIGLPTSAYNFLLKNFQKNTSMLCSASNAGPVCPHSGYITDLPNITLTIQDQVIPIPPQIYVKNYYWYNPNNNDYYPLTLNFRELNSSMVNESYVTSSYQNSIILDMNFMNYYMTVFNGSGYADNLFTVGLYATPANYVPPGPGPNPPSPNPTPSPDNTWIPIVCGVVGFIILVVIIVCVVRIIKKKRTQQNSYEPQNVQNFSREEPLLINQQQNMPYQQYQPYENAKNNMPAPQMGYNQNYYDNQQQQQYYPQTYGNTQGYQS